MINELSLQWKLWAFVDTGPGQLSFTGIHSHHASVIASSETVHRWTRAHMHAHARKSLHYSSTGRFRSVPQVNDVTLWDLSTKRITPFPRY